MIECIIPVTFFATRFGLFRESTTVVDELGNVIARNGAMLNGWGIISCILVGSFITNFLKQVSDSYIGYSFIKQCCKGLYSTMPLIIAFAVCYFLNGVLEKVTLCLIVIIICKLIAVPINPLPKWKYERLGKEEYDSFVECFTKIVKRTIKGGDK